MDLSVIVPCHNLENYIHNLLNSLNDQNLYSSKVELIFVCDGCTDNTIQVIRDYPFKHDFAAIRIYQTNFCKCGLARNVGLENARGKYIWFMDGDDWLRDDDAIEKIIEILDYTHEPLIRFDYEAPGFKAKTIDAMVWQYVYSKDFIGDLRFQDIQPHEDREFMYEILKKVDNVLYFDESLYHYNYMREGSNMFQWTKNGKIEP